ncbi:hypothetical protein QQF64_034306 [Cirrhinus molitorella]|uniref:Peptidase A2 domain-containing protein n=1 Tax=Cirrhinus molitorella TaxID=172907 RepID=A0ABR3L1N1_9TELE
MAQPTGPADHWEDLEVWLNIMTATLTSKAAETLTHLTQDQLDERLSSIMEQDPSRDYSHKELAKILGSLSHTLIASHKLSESHADHLQQELTGTQQRNKQLELEAQDRQEGMDRTDSSAKEEIARLKETLVTASQEKKDVESAYAELASKLQYAEQLLEKAKTDFRDKNGRIKALEMHLNEARTEIDYLTQQLDHIKEESDSVKDELKHAYELRPKTAKARQAPASPLTSRAGSPVSGMLREERGKGATEKASPAPSEDTYLTTKLKELPQSSQRPSQSMDLKDLDKLVKNISKFNPSTPGCQDVQAYLKDIDFQLEMRGNITDKDKLYLLRMTSSPELRDLAHKAYGKQKMASEKGGKSPAVLDIATQSQGMPLEGAQHHEDVRPPPKEWRSSSYNKERDSQAGTRSKQRGNRWDGTRGKRSPGRYWEKSWDQSRPQENRQERSWHSQTSSGGSRTNSWESSESSKGSRLPRPGATSPRNRRKYSQRPTLIEPKLNHTRTKDLAMSRFSRTAEDDDERVLPTQGRRSEMGKEREAGFGLTSIPESAVLVVCHSPEEHQISPDILPISSQTPVPQLLGDLIERGIARKFYLSIIIERHIKVEALLDTGADITLMSTELLEEIQERTKGNQWDTQTSKM